MAVRGSKDALPGVRDNFFTNLLLLGFNTTQSEVQYKIVFNKDMFASPNKKGMEVVMYYLFYKLDEKLCYERYRDCWPVFDKKQGQQFRKICSEWITSISKEAPNSDLPRSSVMGLLLNPGGEKFYHFLRDFSTYVLEEDLKKNAPDDFLVPNLSMEYETHPILREVHVGAMKKMIIMHLDNVNKRFQVAAECHKEWRNHVSKLTGRIRDANEQNRKLKKRLSDLQTLQRKTASAKLPPSVSTSQRDVEVMIDKELSEDTRTARMIKVKQLWKLIQDFVKENDHQKKVIDSILSGNVDQHVINAKELYLKIPELLIKKYQQADFIKGLVDNMYEEGKPNILSLLNLWNISLEELYNTLQLTPIEVRKSSVEYSKKELYSCRASLAKQLQKKSVLEKNVEEVRNQISKLRAKLGSVTACVTTGQCTVQRMPYVPMPQYTVPPLNTSLLQPTPLKQQHSFYASNSPGNAPNISQMTPTHELSTPERVKKLNKSIQRHAAAKKSNQTGTSLLTTASLSVATNKTSDVSPVAKRIEIEYDDSDEDDATLSNLDTTCDTITLDVSTSPRDPQENSPHKTDAIALNNTNPPSPKDPKDILADKIASYVAASSDGSSPDSMLYFDGTTSSDEEVSGTMGKENEREENQTNLLMTELQYCSSSEEEVSAHEGVEWPVGVTPDIKAVKARISQQHQLQLTKDTVARSLKDELTSVPESETSWLHFDHDDKGLFLVPSTPRLSKTQQK